MKCGAPVTGFSIGSILASSTPETKKRPVRPSMSHSNSISAKTGSGSFSIVEP